MFEDLKKKVGSGGIDPARLSEGQLALEEALEESESTWILTYIASLVTAWQAVKSGSSEDNQAMRPVIEQIVNLIPTARSMKNHDLVDVARALLRIAEEPGHTDPAVTNLIDLHISTIQVLATIGSRTKEDKAMSIQVISELGEAVKYVAKN